MLAVTLMLVAARRGALRGAVPIAAARPLSSSALDSCSEAELEAALRRKALDREVPYDYRAAGGFCATVWDSCSDMRETIHEVRELADGM